MSRLQRIVLAAVSVVLVSGLGFAWIMPEGAGKWPKSWPEELEELRDQARTTRVMHGIQERLYEITFDDAEQFQKVWPYILKVKSPGSPLILETSPSMYCVSGTCCPVGVRILAPSDGSVGLPDGSELTAGPPWPEHLRTAEGTLPEYVTIKDGKWIAADRDNPEHIIFHRARTDIMLIVDGDVVDLNKIPLPADTCIIDNRFKEQDEKEETEAK